jgi:hypothetical protein
MIVHVILTIIWVCAGLAWAYLAWASYCNVKCARQRLALLDRCNKIARRDHEAGQQAYAAFMRVSHDQHVRSLIQFRDPMKLYASPLGSKT